jgi:SlyX protein
MDARLIELEAKLTLAEDLLDELNHTIFRQQQQIEQMQRQLSLVWQQVQSQQSLASVPEAETRDLREEIPPHY